ncbi:MAG: LuxR C-terminal-related transcriptional regulator [Kibdelosporangium sp.]
MLTGRAAELARLLGALDEPGLVEVTGDAGIGKTALLAAFADAARAKGAVVLTGQARHGLFADAFDEVPADHRALTAELARLGATALVLDDVHLADSHSLETLAGLLRRPARVLVVLGYRDRQAPARLRTALNARQTVRLAPLSECDVLELLDGKGTTSWRQRLYRDSEGNPGYLRVLVAEQPAFSPYLDASRTEQRALTGDYAALLAELDGLSPFARVVADAAAVIGNAFEADLLVRALDRPPSVVLDAVGELIQWDLVRPVVRGQYYAFRHPVMRRAVYYVTELGSRVATHVRIDAVLRERGAPAIDRAPHVVQWAQHGDVEAVDVLTAAGQAVLLTAPNTAAAWLRTALRILPHDPIYQLRRGVLLVWLAKARGVCGYLRECRDLAHEALAALPREPKSTYMRVVAFTAMVQRLLGTYAEADAMLRAEVALLGPGDTSPACGMLKFEIAAVRLGNGEPDACLSWAHEALAMAGESSTLQAACHGLIALAHATTGELGTASESLDLATHVLDGMLDNQFARSTDAVVWIAWAEMLLERWDDALRHFTKAVEFATSSGYRLGLPHLLVGRMSALRNRGSLAEAQAAAEHAVHLAHQSGSPEQLISAFSIRAWTATVLDRPAEAAESDRIAMSHAKASSNGWCEPLALRMLAEARLFGGDHDGCLALAATVGGPHLLAADACSRVAWYELLTRAELAAGGLDAAAKWAESAAADAALLGQPGRSALADLARAHVLLVREPDAALDSAQRAVIGLEQSGMVVDALRAKVVLGVAMWHQGRCDDAMGEIRGAENAFSEIGASVLARYARTERRRLAARRRPGAVAGSLTRREQQISDMVGKGLTNRQIAKRLHIAEKTVEMHLSNVFTKLGVSTRTAVAALVITGSY